MDAFVSAYYEHAWKQTTLEMEDTRVFLNFPDNMIIKASFEENSMVNFSINIALIFLIT